MVLRKKMAKGNTIDIYLEAKRIPLLYNLANCACICNFLVNMKIVCSQNCFTIQILPPSNIEKDYKPAMEN